MVDPGAADEALGILRSGRERVQRENHRQELVMRGARAVSTVLWLARKDIRDPGLRRTCHVALFLVSAGWAWWQFDRLKVQGLWTEQQTRTTEAAARLKRRQEEGASEDELREHTRAVMAQWRPDLIWAGAYIVIAPVAQRLILAGFRRTGMRYPHLATGVVMAAANTTFGWLWRRRKRASDDG